MATNCTTNGIDMGVDVNITQRCIIIASAAAPSVAGLCRPTKWCQWPAGKQAAWAASRIGVMCSRGNGAVAMSDELKVNPDGLTLVVNCAMTPGTRQLVERRG